MRSVPDPIHEAQRNVGKAGARKVVLDDNCFPRDSRTFGEEYRGIVGMMQDIHEQHDVHALTSGWQLLPIEQLNWYERLWP